MQKPITTASPNSNSVGVKSPSFARYKPESTSIIVYLFLLGLLIPLQIYVGPLRLSPYRIVLLLGVIPFMYILFSGGAGKVRAADYFIIAYALWAIVSLLIAHGLEESFEFAGMFFVETVGPYLVARCFIRNATNYIVFVKIMFYSILILLPFTFFEALTDRTLILDFFEKFSTTFPNVYMEPRLGLNRAQGVFEHPILYGSFCASAMGLVYYVLGYKKSKSNRVFGLGSIGFATFLSLSSGAFTAYLIQLMLILWDIFTRKIQKRWSILGGLCLSAYIFVDIYSNRTPVEVFIYYLTFNFNNSYNRVLIWIYGTASVWDYPLFGIGLNEFKRPWWMHASMDNFWLVAAVRYGLPGFIFLACATIFICWQLGQLKNITSQINQFRYGILITIGGLSIAGATVHFWNATYCLFMFLLGSGMWMLDQENQQEEEDQPEKTKPRMSVFGTGNKAGPTDQTLS